MDETSRVGAAIELLDATSEAGRWITDTLDQLREKYHTDLEEASIQVLLKYNWSEDRQGNTPIGALKVVPEIFWRLLDDANGGEGAPDFVLILNGKLWKVLGEKQKLYVLDELLCYGGPRPDKEGEQALDDTGRRLWRTVKPQFAGFAAPIRRHGAQMKNIRNFMSEAKRGHQQDLPFVPGERPGKEERQAEVIHYFKRRILDGDDVVMRFTSADFAPTSLDGIHVLKEEDRLAGAEQVRDNGELEYEVDGEVLRAYVEALEDEQDEKRAGAEPAQDLDTAGAPEESEAAQVTGEEVAEVLSAAAEGDPAGDEDDQGAVLSIPPSRRGRRGKEASAAPIH